MSQPTFRLMIQAKRVLSPEQGQAALAEMDRAIVEKRTENYGTVGVMKLEGVNVFKNPFTEPFVAPILEALPRLQRDEINYALFADFNDSLDAEHYRQWLVGVYLPSQYIQSSPDLKALADTIQVHVMDVQFSEFDEGAVMTF